MDRELEWEELQVARIVAEYAGERAVGARVGGLRAERAVRSHAAEIRVHGHPPILHRDRKSTRLNSSHGYISYAVFCLKKKKYVTLDGFNDDDTSDMLLRHATTDAFQVYDIVHNN